MNDSIRTIGKLNMDLDLASVQMETALMYAERLNSKIIKTRVKMIMSLINDIKNDVLIEESNIIRK